METSYRERFLVDSLCCYCGLSEAARIWMRGVRVADRIDWLLTASSLRESQACCSFLASVHLVNAGYVEICIYFQFNHLLA